MHIIITGGTGLIGTPLVKALVADGHEVTVLTRNPDKVKSAAATAKYVKWDGETSAGWGALADGAGAIINLAGAGIADGRWTDARKKEIRASRINAGKAVMAAIKSATVKPKVLIQGSAVGYYGTDTGDKLVTESFPAGNDFLAKVCSDWEMSTAPAATLGVRRATIRTGIVLSNEGGALPKLVMPFKFFMGGPVGSGKQWLPWIHIDDEVRAIQFLLANENAEGPFNLAAPNPVTNAEMGKAVGEQLGRPSFMPAPSFALKSVLGDMSIMVLEGQRAVPGKLDALGFQFKFATAADALRDILKGAAPTAPPTQVQSQQDKVKA